MTTWFLSLFFLFKWKEGFPCVHIIPTSSKWTRKCFSFYKVSLELCASSCFNDIWDVIWGRRAAPTPFLGSLPSLSPLLRNPKSIRTGDLASQFAHLLHAWLCSWVGVRSKRVTDNDRVPDTSCHCEALLMELRRVANKVVWPQTK